MKKKILFLTLFILIILLCNNSYAFDNTLELDVATINSQFNSNFVDLNLSSIIDYINTNGKIDLYNSSNNLTIRYQNNTYGAFTKNLFFYFYNSDYLYINSNNYVTENSSSIIQVKCTYDRDFNFVSCDNIFELTSVYFGSNYQMITSANLYADDKTTINFAANDSLIIQAQPEEPEEPEEPIQVDLSKISQDLDYIKAFLFYICLYLLCKTIYGVIWWIYKKTIL